MVLRSITVRATSTALQEAGRRFRVRLIERHGLARAARVLRALADEPDSLMVV
jgi:hypothetical protein